MFLLVSCDKNKKIVIVNTDGVFHKSCNCEKCLSEKNYKHLRKDEAIELGNKPCEICIK